MSKSTKKATKTNRASKQKSSFGPHDEFVQSTAKENMSRGVTYVAITALVLLVLLYIFPVVLKLDISAFLQGEKQLGSMRIILGIILLVVLGISLVRIVNANTLTGESFLEGIKNACVSGQISRNLLSIMILIISGILLIVWGITGIIS